ncbi:EpsG family protein [Clostridium disporicum]|uniref:EpsG family protein n=1 Tax=Clostridium disporicum TaxID=84024 RepID=UPI003622D898
MLPFYSTIISTYIFYFLARISYDKKFKILAIFWSTVVALILIFVSGLRSGIGDTYFYKHSYTILAQNPNSFVMEGDFALNLLSLFLINFTSDPQILIFVAALITNLLNVIMFNKYRTYLELQVYIYITSGYYFVTMNGIRQCIAAALLFICTPLIIKGKFFPYCICVLLISTFHQSALALILIYFVARQEAWSKRMMQFMGIALIGIVCYQVLSPILFKVLEDTTYGQYGSSAEGGSSLMRTIVNAVPVILAYLKRKELAVKWPIKDVFVNMSIINLIFVALGMFNWIFNRFTLYLQLYNFVLIPSIIKNGFKGKERRLIYIAVIVCYFIFMYYEQVMGMGMKYSTDCFDINKFFYY